MSSLETHDLSLHLNRTHILHRISLTVTAGSRHVITGHNGAGKSSLLSMLTGTIRPTGGKIYLAGRDITGWAPHQMARAGVARLWQHPQIWEPLSVSENLAVALQVQARSPRVDQALDQAGLTQLAEERAGALSYGQRRRVELAIALAQKPTMLILDEPSAGLSARSRQALATMLTSTGSNLTLLMTDHDHGLLAQIATHRTELAGGTIVRTGAAWWDEPTPIGMRQPPSRPTPIGPAMLSVRELAVDRNGRAVLQGVNLAVAASEIIAVTGPNGSGKSTLIAAIAGLIRHRSGEIAIDGEPLSSTSASSRARAGLHTLIQDHHVWDPLTVAQTLRLCDVGVDALARFPQLDGRLGQRAASLSGGEKQLLAIALALANQPRVVLLDEPFEGLSHHASVDMASLLADQSETGTALVISGHRMTGLMAPLHARVIDLDALQQQQTM